MKIYQGNMSAHYDTKSEPKIFEVYLANGYIIRFPMEDCDRVSVYNDEEELIVEWYSHEWQQEPERIMGALLFVLVCKEGEFENFVYPWGVP